MFIIFNELALLAAVLAVLASTEAYNIGSSYRSAQDFAALQEDGTIAMWGPNGVRDERGFHGTFDIYSTVGAFTALNLNGTVKSFGNHREGGRHPPGLGNVRDVVSTGYAFAAIQHHGHVVCW